MASAQKPKLDEVIWQDKDRMSGAPCFRGTRIRVQDLFDWIRSGATVDEFLEAYPQVSRDGLLLVIESAERGVLSHWKAA